MRFMQTIAANTLFQVIARIATSGTTFLITILIAHAYGVSGYGDFAKVTAFVSLFYLFADFGLNAVFLQQKDAKERFADLFYLRTFFGILLLLAVNVIAALLPYNPVTGTGFSPAVHTGISIYSLTLLTEALVYSATVVFQQNLSYEYFMMSSFIGSLVTLLLVFGITRISTSLPLLLVCFVLGGVAKSASALLFAKRAVLPVTIDVVFVKKLLVETLPITFMLVCNLIYFRIDMFLLSLLKPSTDVALYDLSYKFFDFFIALPLFLSNALYPSLLQRMKENSISSTTIKKYSGVFFLLSLCVIIPVWIASPALQFIRPEFLSAMVPLRILLVSLPAFFVTSILQWVLIAKKQQKFLALVYFLLTIFNVIANLVFIPQFSYIAASIITDIGEVLVLVVLWAKLFANNKYGK
ncbi:MAG: oligosaccharide flippase family protein [Patescibacteria group bacterium]|nr:oligosaccharide flippase family protein [Patescibacteria group bacterium]